MVQVRKYARVVAQQSNPNITQRNDWHKIKNAINKTDEKAYSSYTRKKVVTKDKKGNVVKEEIVHNYPWKITAYDFGFNIPEYAHINSITVGIRMDTDTKYSGKANKPVFPKCGFYIADRKTGVKNKSVDGTGWDDGIYWVKSDTQISKSLYTEQYTMSGANFRKGKYTVKDLNSTYFGLDFDFANKCDDQHIFVKWIWVRIDYDLPEYELYHDVKNNTQFNPLQMMAGVGKPITYTLKQKTNAKGGTHELDLVIPWGSKALYMSATNSTVQKITDGLYKWTVNCNGKTTATISFDLMDYTVNSQIAWVMDMTVDEDENPVPEKPQSRFLYYKTERGGSIDGYGQIEIGYDGENAPSPHKRHLNCFKMLGLHQSDDDELTYWISDTYARDVVSIELGDMTSSGVSIVSDGLDHRKESTYYSANAQIPVVFQVPSGSEDFYIDLRLCQRPHSSGDSTLTVLEADGYQEYNYSYNIAEPFVYHIGSTLNDSDTEWHEGLSGEVIRFTNHRIASNIETGAFVLPCGVKPIDSLMIQDSPHIHMYKWEEIDYIGCVPVEHYHFDPKSTYKDSLLNTSYKNNRFMGKQLSPDEDISLNIRLHPPQVTTIQGLIDMDKPIPINANHKCFESDALNHRGWAEIYSIKSEKTNPHWYKCDIDVKYLTHNLNTRFKIKKGDKTFNEPIPSMLAEINGSGEQIGENENDFFIVDTDGTYAFIDDVTEVDDFYDGAGNTITWLGYGADHTFTNFDEEEVTMKGEYLLAWLDEMGEEYREPVLNQDIQVIIRYNTDKVLKNKFTLDEGQHISIKTRNPVSTINQISFSWLSSRLLEEKENNISRIIRLIDADNDNVVFEYEYCDFDFSSYQEYTDVIDDSLTGILSCRVIGRVKNKNDFETPINHIINLATDVETSRETYTDPETGELLQNLQYFGSTLNFRLNNKQLTVIDEGYNGKELERTVDLIEGNQYKWESYWVNKNTDGEDNDISSYMDIVVQNSILEARNQDDYSKMYVSPFPVKDKKILFTRQAEEGVIYYLKDDEEEFTYLLEPYYIYHNGVDLRNEAGSSIFNLNYGYKTVYLENGLVSLGINRLNGRMYLRKYDSNNKQYVALFNLELNKYDDININSISDDRIELQASDSTIIMYRGHPYVIIRHPTEEININTKSYQVYGQCVDGMQPTLYPAMIDLMNKDNLLPECVTKKLDDDCVTVSEEDIGTLQPVDLILTKDDTEEFIFEGNSLDFTVTGQPTGSKVCFLVKKITPNDDSLQGYDEVGCTTTGLFNHKFDESGAFNVIAVYVGDDTYEYAISKPVPVNVNAELTEEEKEIIDPSGDKPDSELSGEYTLDINSPSVFTYRDNQKITFTLKKGGIPLPNHILEVVDFTHMNTEETSEKENTKGQVTITNSRADTHPKKYKIGARFYVTDRRTVKKVYKDVEVRKAKPVFHVSGAGIKGMYFTCKLLHELSDGTKYVLPNRKITVEVNGKKHEGTTNSKGNCSIMIKDAGTYKYKCSFAGDKDYEPCSIKFRESVKKW